MSDEEAAAKARANISKSLTSMITYSLVCRQFRDRNVTLVREEITDQQSITKQDCERRIDSSTSANLTGTRLIMREERGGQVYVAMEYDSRVLHKKVGDYIRNLASEMNQGNCVDSESPLASTDFHKLLQGEIGPGICVPPWQLQHNDFWTVRLAGGQFTPNQHQMQQFFPESPTQSATLEFFLTLNQHQMQQFFPESPTQSVPLKLPEVHEIVAGMEYEVTATSEKEGYLTVLQANQLGRVQHLSRNYWVKPGSNIRFPQERNLSFISMVDDGYTYAEDLYVALLCENQMYFNYPHIDEGEYPTENNYGSLLRWLGGEGLSNSGCVLTLSRLRISRPPS